MVIKWCTRSLLFAKGFTTYNKKPKKGADVYLQCNERCFLAFYTDCGFVGINGVEETGKHLLPESIAATLKEGDRNSIWLVPETKETIYVALLKLKAGCLLHPRMKEARASSDTAVNPRVKEGKQSSDTKIKSFVW